MSLATLKKKTATKYNAMSVGSKQGFSINGTHRSQGYIGQTSLSRYIPKTPMKGSAFKGHGGCCGTFKIRNINASQQDVNDNTQIKSSSINNNGLISSKYRWIRRPYPYISVKPDNNNNLNTSQEYTTRLAKQTVSDSNDCQSSTKDTCMKTSCAGMTVSNYSNYSKNAYNNTSKDSSTFVAMNQSRYISELRLSCIDNDVVTVQKNTGGTPYV